MNELPDLPIPRVTLTIGEIRSLYESPNAVFGMRDGRAKIYFVQVPSVSALHSFRHQEVMHGHYS